MALREIIFRGKRLDNGEFVEGALVVKHDPLLDISYCFIIAQGKKDSFVTWHKVDPSTVGQYTGLKDKNGKRIFEGDILKVTWGDASGKPPVSYLVVVFEYGAFTTRHTKSDTQFGTVATYTSEQLGVCGVFCEVIGNIHDNPELLEVAHDN